MVEQGLTGAPSGRPAGAYFSPGALTRMNDPVADIAANGDLEATPA
jgi:hypothetical protein